MRVSHSPRVSLRGLCIYLLAIAVQTALVAKLYKGPYRYTVIFIVVCLTWVVWRHFFPRPEEGLKAISEAGTMGVAGTPGETHMSGVGQAHEDGKSGA